MGYRYEYEEVEDPSMAIGGAVLNALLPGGDASTCWKCTIYDDETGEELAEALGNTKEEAKWEAQAKL